ncbi:TPA: GDSL-type esterase/lipase family protein [Clostridium perfringens]
MIRGDKGLNIVFTGDSITHGPLHTKGYRSYTEHFRERLKEKFKNENIMVFNTGVSGATTRDIINDFHICVNIYDPDIVFIMLGMNDSSNQIVSLEEYRSNIIELINKVREFGAIPILQTSNTIKMDLSRKSLKFYMEVIREIASEKNVMLMDHYSHWEELEKENPNLKNELLNDLIHPNEKGHLEIVKFIFKELDIFDEDSYTCNLSYPIKVENDLGRRVDTTYYPSYEGVEGKKSLVSYKIEKMFSGDFIDKSKDLNKVSNLEKGSIVSRFKVENNRNNQTILSFFDSRDDDSNLILAINNGKIHFSVREKGVFSINITTSKGGYNDGMWHTLAIDVRDHGTKIYVDGELINSKLNKGFFKNISNANSFNIGRNLDNKDYEEGFYYGHISYIDIYEENLSQEELIKSTKENFNDNLESMTNLINEDEKGVWVFWGDRDTTGKGNTFGYKNYVEYVEERIRWELNDGSINKRERFMINSGIEEANSEYLMNNFEYLVSKYNPKAVFIMIGGYEKITPEEFKQNLIHIIGKIKSINSIPVLQSPIKNERNIEEYIKAIREVAKEEEILLIDHYKYWYKLSKGQELLQKSWLVEGSPNHRGHLEIAKKILKDLRIYNYNSLTCGFTIETPWDKSL